MEGVVGMPTSFVVSRIVSLCVLRLVCLQTVGSLGCHGSWVVVLQIAVFYRSKLGIVMHSSPHFSSTALLVHASVLIMEDVEEIETGFLLEQNAWLPVHPIVSYLISYLQKCYHTNLFPAPQDRCWVSRFLWGV